MPADTERKEGRGTMTRLELLQILIGKAREKGFDFKRWYTACLRLPWENAHAALEVVESQRRYYALLFHHDFAKAFWKEGETITFTVPAQTFERLMPDGSVKVVERKPFMRRTGRTGGWRYHLGQMALQEEPLRYMRKFVNVEEEIDVPSSNLKIEAETAVAPSARKLASKTLELARRSAERRKRMEEEVRARQEKELEKLLPIPPSKSKRGARLPGSR